MAYPSNGGKPIFKEIITPVGLLVHLNHDRPLLKTDENTKRPIMDAETGIQEAEWRVTIAFEKTRVAELQPIVQLIKEVTLEAWPESVTQGNFFKLEKFFRDGDSSDNSKRREYLFGHYYINMKSKATATRGEGGKIVYGGSPGLVGPYGEDIMPLDIWSGCKGRVSGILFGTDYLGKHYASTRLNNIQLHSTGDRLGGTGRPDPKSQFGPLIEGGPGLQNVL